MKSKKPEVIGSKFNMGKLSIDNYTLFEMGLVNMVRIDVLQQIILEAQLTSEKELAEKLEFGVKQLMEKIKDEKIKFDEEMKKMIIRVREDKLSELLENVKPQGSC